MSNPLIDLLPSKPAPPSSTWLWATVTATYPLQVQIDTEDAPLDGTPSTLVPVSVGDRVYVVITQRQATIVGLAGGVPTPETFDSGEVTLTPSSTWNGSSSEGVHIARYGRMVHLSAVVVSSTSTSGKTTILTIPSGYRPGAVVYATSYAGTANLQVSTGGVFSCWTDVPSGTTVRWSTTWYTNDPEPS